MMEKLRFEYMEDKEEFSANYTAMNRPLQTNILNYNNFHMLFDKITQFAEENEVHWVDFPTLQLKNSNTNGSLTPDVTSTKQNCLDIAAIAERKEANVKRVDEFEYHRPENDINTSAFSHSCSKHVDSPSETGSIQSPECCYEHSFIFDYSDYPPDVGDSCQNARKQRNNENDDTLSEQSSECCYQHSFIFDYSTGSPPDAIDTFKKVDKQDNKENDDAISEQSSECCYQQSFIFDYGEESFPPNNIIQISPQSSSECCYQHSFIFDDSDNCDIDQETRANFSTEHSAHELHNKPSLLCSCVSRSTDNYLRPVSKKELEGKTSRESRKHQIGWKKRLQRCNFFAGSLCGKVVVWFVQSNLLF